MKTVDINGSSYGHRGTWERRTLCRELATGDLSKAALGRKYGISTSAITQFSQRHATEIATIKGQLDAEFAGLWIADKASRIAAYQADYDAAADSDRFDHHEWIKARTDILHKVAEETGQLPPRATVAVMPVVHIIENVDLEALK